VGTAKSHMRDPLKPATAPCKTNKLSVPIEMYQNLKLLRWYDRYTSELIFAGLNLIGGIQVRERFTKNSQISTAALLPPINSNKLPRAPVLPPSQVVTRNRNQALDGTSIIAKQRHWSHHPLQEPLYILQTSCCESLLRSSNADPRLSRDSLGQAL
jgi:hypothetical protein